MITVLIAGADRTEYVQWPTVRIDNILTKQVDRCTFTIENDVGYAPTVGASVVITDSGTRVFGGVIVRRTQTSSVVGRVKYAVECSDFTRILDQHLVAETYENLTVNQIIDDLVANWLPAGFTATQVDCDTTVDYVQFKYEPVSDCIRQIADLVGYDWYVDYDMDIYFKSPTATDAPFDIEDDTGVYSNNSLVIRLDNSQMRNSIIVRGGEYAGTEFTASVRADGKQVTFNLPYKYENFAATLTGKPLTIGIDYIDNPDSYDALYNFNEKLIRFKPEDRPNQNATLSFSGNPLLPVVVSYRDPTLIASTLSAEGVGDGEYEYLVVDKSINTQVAARQRAAAEINTYGETLSEGEFDTESSGLRAGQRIRINSVSRGIDEYFIINKVTSTMPSPTTMVYKVSLITTKTMDFISIMKKLLLAENKKIVITNDELLNLTQSMSETITITDAVFTGQPHNRFAETISMVETFTAQALDYPVQFVLADYVPSIGEDGPDTNIQHRLLFDGSANDTSGNLNNGTITNAALTSDRNGLSNQAYSFNGTTARITFAKVNNVNGNHAFSMSVIFKVTALPASDNAFVYGIYAGNFKGFGVYITPSGEIRSVVGQGGASNVDQTIKTGLSLGTYYHVLLTYNGSVIKAYLDGVEVASNTTSTVDNGTDQIAVAGRSAWDPAYGFLNGTIDRVDVWSAGLSVSERHRVFEPERRVFILDQSRLG